MCTEGTRYNEGIVSLSFVYIALGAYLLILFAIAYISGRGESREDFLVAGRNRSWWQILFSKYASSIGISWFITYTAFSYEYGWWIYLLVFGSMIGYIGFAYWAGPRIRQHANKQQFHTIGDYVAYATSNPYSRIIANIFAIAMMLVFAILTVVGGAQIVAYFDLLSYESALILTVTIVGLYIVAAGFKAVLLSDVFQAIIILIVLIGLCWGIL